MESDADALLRFRSFTALVRLWSVISCRLLVQSGHRSVCGTIRYMEFTRCVAARCKFSFPTATARTVTCLSKLSEGLGKSAARSSTTGAWEHVRCLGILVYLLTSLVCWLFHIQSNKPKFGALLTSTLAVNYHSTTQNLSPLCTSTPSLSRATPPTPSPIVTGRTTKWFYFPLADQFKILGRQA